MMEESLSQTDKIITEGIHKGQQPYHILQSNNMKCQNQMRGRICAEMRLSSPVTFARTSPR